MRYLSNTLAEREWIDGIYQLEYNVLYFNLFQNATLGVEPPFV